LSLSFSPDSQTIASASQDNRVILWNLDLDELVLEGCHWLQDYLANNPNQKSDRQLCQ
jgi:WD40 repeat protein